MRKVLRFACFGLLLSVSCKQEIPSGVHYGKGGGLSNPELDETVDDLRRDLHVVAWVTKEHDHAYEYEYQVAFSMGKNPLHDAAIRINGEYLYSSSRTYDSSFAYYEEDDYGNEDMFQFSLTIEAPNGQEITGSLELYGGLEILFPPNYYDHCQDSSLTVAWAPIRSTNYYRLEVMRSSVKVHSSGFLSDTAGDYTIPKGVFDSDYYYVYVYAYKGFPVSADSTLLPRHVSDGISGASGCFIGIFKSYVIVDVY